jgi:hypothetical protein
VTLLLSLALVGAISPPEMEPSAEVVPAETSPTSVEDPTAPSDLPVEAEPPPAPAAEIQPAAVETQPVAAESSRPSEAPPPGPPGGYWTFAEAHEHSGEPLDGDDELTIGSVLFSLGFLRAGAGVLTARAVSADRAPQL